ncbi:hypothetical protein M8C21_017679 [Ambrosia artemisiifolia]|uniref:Uncharacterized protein n=1 Tax=Ambrosia artemisiifolia TaxID=4212 RepID=A0AAD5D3N7_AMBAR|nr:hypothetical protein M8C21_017679 [Ambrosia artemisiifolia]
MALQATSFSVHTLVNLPSKTTGSLKDSTLLGVSLYDHRKVDFNSLASKSKMEFKRTKLFKTQAVAITSTPPVTRAAPGEKKTLRKGTRMKLLLLWIEVVFSLGSCHGLGGDVSCIHARSILLDPGE